MAEIREIHASDLDHMALNMRAIDGFEFDTMGGGRPRRECLEHLFSRSRYCRAGFFDGRLVALFGVIAPTALSTSGSPWMCAAEGAAEDPGARRAIIEHTRSEIAHMAVGFDRLWNVVSAENALAIRWLKWAGFHFDGRSYDVAGHSFLRFELETQNVF